MTVGHAPNSFDCGMINANLCYGRAKIKMARRNIRSLTSEKKWWIEKDIEYITQLSHSSRLDVENPEFIATSKKSKTKYLLRMTDDCFRFSEHDFSYSNQRLFTYWFTTLLWFKRSFIVFATIFLECLRIFFGWFNTKL